MFVLGCKTHNIIMGLGRVSGTHEFSIKKPGMNPFENAISHFHNQNDSTTQERKKKKMKKEDTVKLISSDGFEFVVDKEAAMVSQTIRNMLTSPGLFFFLDHFTFL